MNEELVITSVFQEVVEWSTDKAMIKIEDIKELELPITWRLLLRGMIKKQLQVDEIVKYAIEHLENGDDRMEICELAGGNDNCVEEVIDILYKLAHNEESQDEFEDRKLRAVRINNFLKVKNTNCIDGLVGLTELWIELDYPSDSPHIFQGKDNDISPVEYYTDENYDYLYEKNKRWLKNEVEFLQTYK